MANTTHTPTNFDPCAIFPARIRKRRFVAQPIEKGGVAGGATDLTKGKAYLPLANTAYARTIRLHEALHAIYTPKPTKEKIKSGKGYTMLEQALEDARLHLNCAKTAGVVRRDELSTALRDLHTATSRRAMEGPADRGLLALIALRAGAILHSQAYGGKRQASADSRLLKLCERVALDYAPAMTKALAEIRSGKMAAASETLQPYFDAEEKEQSTARKFPGMISGEPTGEDDKMAGKDFVEVTFDKLDGKITSDAAELLSGGTVAAINGTAMPTLFINPMYASSMIPTFFGETQKHVISGCKISAKKLATIVGPATPKVFLKTIRRNGGAVLIDASGSMSISPEQLLKLVNKAPAATIAFYNAPTDSRKTGNLWIYCHKGKRAADFSTIDFSRISRRNARDGETSRNVYGWGNVVDFQALQWLLTQEGPRYVLTDGVFTGPSVSRKAARELLGNAIARKKLTQVTSLAQLEELLAKAR